MGSIWKLKGESSCVDRITVKNVTISTSAGHIMGDVDANTARREKMRTLKFIVTGQHIEKDPICDFSGLVPGTKGYLRAAFVFDQEWSNCKKVAVFVKYGREFPAPIINGYCNIPPEVLTHGRFSLYVIGERSGGYRIPTSRIEVRQDG